MTLLEIRDAFPELFYLDQHWYEDQAFAKVQPVRRLGQLWTSEVPHENALPVRAVELAAKYVTCPDDSIWRKFLWADDVDSWGEPVYVGGIGQYGIDAFQIHRHLTPACYRVLAL